MRAGGVRVELLPIKGKMLDFVNLIEQSLPDLIKKYRKIKANVRFQGIIILPKRSMEVYFDLKDGRPILAIVREDNVEVKGDIAWQEISLSMGKAAGFVEIYELSAEEVDEDLKLRPDAKVKYVAPIRIKLPQCHPNIEEYSRKLATTVTLKTNIIVNSVHLNARAEKATATASLPSVLLGEIDASENAARYIAATLYDSPHWKSVELMAKNRLILAAIANSKDGIVYGRKALKLMLSPRLLGEYKSFDILIYDVKVDPLDILEERIRIPKRREAVEAPSALPKELTVTELREMPKPAEVEEEVEEVRKVDVEAVRNKARDYFADVLDTLGYELKKVEVQLNDKVKFKAKVKKKRFAFRAAKEETLKKELMDEAEWIMEELGLKREVEVEIVKI